MNSAGGRGYGSWGRGGGRGGGWGRRNWFYATGLPGWQRAPMGLPAYGAPAGAYAAGPVAGGAAMTATQQLDVLKQQAEYFENALGEIRKSIEELGKQADG